MTVMTTQELSQCALGLPPHPPPGVHNLKACDVITIIPALLIMA